MKKIVVAGLVAISMLAIAQQNASAWVNSRFGVGLNWDYQSGGNNFLWGAWRNGQPPGPEAFGAGGGGGFPRFGMPQQSFGQMQQPFAAPAPMPQAPQGFFDAQSYSPQYSAPYAMPQYSTPYQFANYPRPSTYYYPSTPYYYYGR